MENTLRVTRHRDTNLMVLDREEHEAVRVFLKQRLICFLGFDCWCHRWLRLDLCIESFDNGLLEVEVVENRCRCVDCNVLFASWLKDELLSGRVTHFQALNAR